MFHARQLTAMRLVHVVPTYFPAVRYGGPIWSVHALCKALVRRGHEVEVLTTNVDGPGNLDVPLGVPVDSDGVAVRYFPSRFLRRLYWSPPMARQFPDILAGADFLHLHSIFLWPTSAAARVGQRLNIPWCIAPRGALVPELVERRSTLVKRMWLGLVERQTIQQAAFLHATSALEGEDAARFGYALPPVHVIPNGVEIPVLDEPVGLPLVSSPENGPLLLFLGRISWKKGLDRLIPAMAFLPDARLAVAGNDEEGLTPGLEALAREVGVADRVRFIGPVTGDRKTALLRAATMLVLPSYSENFGNVILESLAAGRPVAMTAEVGLAPVVAEAGAGIILPGDTTAMGKALAASLANLTYLDAMGARGRQLVEQRYSWDRVAAEMETAYMEAIAARRKCIA